MIGWMFDRKPARPVQHAPAPQIQAAPLLKEPPVDPLSMWAATMSASTSAPRLKEPPVDPLWTLPAVSSHAGRANGPAWGSPGGTIQLQRGPRDEDERIQMRVEDPRRATETGAGVSREAESE